MLIGGTMFKKLFLLAVLAAFTCVAYSCEPTAALPNKNVSVMNNDLEGGALLIQHKVNGEVFTFTTRYSTSYNVDDWQITDSKTLKMEAWLEQSAYFTGTTLLDNVHVDCNIQSKYQIMDGVLQDTMDDRLHTGDQPGFLVSDIYPYENTFSIEGYSQWLVEGWGYFNTSYGYTSYETVRLTEQNLRGNGGVMGNKFTIVYDLLIRNQGEEFYHTRSIVDEFIVPVGELK
jgi:hypothetical protein